MEYKISQLFSLLINNGIFCFIEKEHNCFKCKFKDLKIKFIAYFIQLEILKADIKSFLEKKFKNNFIICPKCCWTKEGIIISNISTYSEIIKNIIPPHIIFWDLSKENVNYEEDFNNLKIYLKEIKNFIKKDFSIFNCVYNIKGIICIKYNRHYSGIFIEIDHIIILF